MQSVPELVKQLHQTIASEMRENLMHKDKAWLVEEVIRLTLKDTTLQQIMQIDTELQLASQERRYQERTLEDRENRVERVKLLNLSVTQLHLLVERLNKMDREQLEREGYLLNPSPKGGGLIAFEERSEAGNALLREVKDLLYALLFGTPEMNVSLERTERELLSITLPRSKRFALDFMMAATEMEVRGSWRDPGGQAHDERVANVIMEIEFGEVKNEAAGTCIATCLRLINDLEVNEVILYNRVTNVEDSSL
jgi:hypothetical protein